VSDIELLLDQGKAKPIPTFPNYLATFDGQIYSYFTNTYLKPSVVDGRRVYKLMSNGVRVGKHAARWVCMAFYGDRGEGMHVDHIDGDKTNDSASNLQWLSQADNMAKSRAKAFVVINPEGELVKGNNIRAFCRKHGLHNGNFSMMLRGCPRFKSVSGWRLPIDEAA